MPRRRRPAARLLIAAAVCLVLGAVVSVGVAVGFGLFGTVVADRHTFQAAWLVEGRFLTHDDFPEGVSRMGDIGMGWAIQTFPHPCLVWMEGMSGTGITDWSVAASPHRRQKGIEVMARVHRTGWPMRVLECRALTQSPFLPTFPDASWSWRVPTWASRPEYIAGYGVFPRPPVPLRPIPVGLTVNAMFFGSVPFAVCLLLGPARRGFRRRRNLCRACGYSRAGLAGGAACPECGKTEA